MHFIAGFKPLSILVVVQVALKRPVSAYNHFHSSSF